MLKIVTLVLFSFLSFSSSLLASENNSLVGSQSVSSSALAVPLEGSVSQAHESHGDGDEVNCLNSSKAHKALIDELEAASAEFYAIVNQYEIIQG